MICILSFIQTIISEVIKVHVDGDTYWIRIKEAPGWTPTFVHDLPAPELADYEIQDNDQNEVHSHYAERNEEVSSDPFGIYDAIEKIKVDEVKNDIQKGFNSWGIGKKNKSNKEGFQGQNGNLATENVIYHSTADCYHSSAHIASQANSSDAPGPAVNLPTIDAGVQVSVAVPIDVVDPTIVAEEVQTAPTASPILSAAPAVNSGISSA